VSLYLIVMIVTVTAALLLLLAALALGSQAQFVHGISSLWMSKKAEGAILPEFCKVAAQHGREASKTTPRKSIRKCSFRCCHSCLFYTF